MRKNVLFVEEECFISLFLRCVGFAASMLKGFSCFYFGRWIFNIRVFRKSLSSFFILNFDQNMCCFHERLLNLRGDFSFRESINNSNHEKVNEKLTFAFNNIKQYSWWCLNTIIKTLKPNFITSILWTKIGHVTFWWWLCASFWESLINCFYYACRVFLLPKIKLYEIFVRYSIFEWRRGKLKNYGESM